MLVRLFKAILGKRHRSSVAVGIDVEQIRDAMRTGDLDKAWMLCDRVLDFQPDNVDALHLAGVIAHQRGDRARAITLLTRAADSSAEPQPSLGLGHVLRESGRLEEAVSCFKRAAQMDPHLYEPQIALADSLYRKGEIAEAEVHLRQAIHLRPDAFEAHQLLTRLLYAQARQGELGEAVRNMQRIKPRDGADIFVALLVPAINQSTQEIG